MAMKTDRRPWIRARAGAVVLAALVALPVLGCFDAPKLEDRWTRVDLVSSSVTNGQTLPAGTAQPIQVGVTVIYRSILTGYAVAELRASSSVPRSSVALGPNAARLPMAQDIDRILASSVTCGRAVRPVTGWDHLMQNIDFAFIGNVPAASDSSMGPTGGLFLLCYLGSGVKVELPSGADPIVVTPFVSSAYQVLPVGLGFAP
jgi:hypothetical protein